ncbi:penicillin-binding protein 2 [Marinospirillum alkaliphilum]|uniref:Peptidoglycan D,D-transpeptidase MrdA n=1 Tax=Marinospirillum alkaliphilum DSM 21637 TaxID=1122209 RepID=A0A1K1YLK0_9GAMM|nr:penicillin-binding protein 2 [Marinospirillum alkaliphilum]SFX62865.1 penicillin-binding protein 2 [Marinospirillum alkaliphilum DSM 21637]
MTEFRRQIKDPEKEMRIFQFRIRLLFLLVLLLMGVLLGRMAYLQVFQYDQHVSRSERNRTSVEAIPPTRGLIYDREGRLLAENLPSHSLTLTRELAGDVVLVVQRICAILELEDGCEEALIQRSRQRRRPFEPALLVDQLDEDQMASIAVNRHLLPGVEISAQLLRHYPAGQALSHVLGYVGRISEEDLVTLDRRAYSGTHYIGKTGVERFYESRLHGEVGYRRVETNARGRVIRVIESQPPVPGVDLTLHLDAYLQQQVYKLLDGRRAAVVAIEPSTGGILALVSSPGYDPNVFVGMLEASAFESLRRDPRQPLFDRASRGQYAPGSTVKPFLGLAALEHGSITRETEMFDPGFFQLPNDERLYRNWRRQGHGVVDLRRSIAVSNNTFFYSLAFNLGIDEISAYMRRFGFGESTALDVHGARSGLMPSREWKRATQRQPWFPGETLSTGIGQGYWLVTPLQLATATAVLANRGEWVAPRLFLHADPPEGHVLQDVQRDPVELKDAENWSYIFRSMEDVMHGREGTARAAGQGAGYRMAGKTGTAQVFSLSQEEDATADELPEHLRDHAVYMGFAPANNPRIALAVVVENAGGGSQVAAPLARKIFDIYLTPERLVSKETARAP